MPTMLLRHYFSSPTITHHPGIHMHINVDVTTLVRCDLIRGMAITVAVHLQALELWAMALAPPAVPKRCTSERQGRKGGGIVAWCAHHVTGQALVGGLRHQQQAESGAGTLGGSHPLATATPPFSSSSSPSPPSFSPSPPLVLMHSMTGGSPPPPPCSYIYRT